jgi:transcriptional regulator with XRE-family HTH domain
MPQTRDRTARKTPLDHDPEAVVWARKAKGATQAWLANAIGVSAGHMSEIESGTRNAHPALLKKIAEALNCPVSVLERKREVGAR